MSVNFGLVGYGAWGRYHARSIEMTEGANLVAISAKSEKSCKKAEKEHGVDVYPDYNLLFERDDIDAVDIVVPNFLHAQVAQAALKAGKHVLLEKPMALKIEDCDKIIEAAKSNERKLQIGFEARLSPLWGKLKEMIEEGAIGEVRYGMIDLWRNPYRKGSGGWRYDKKRVGDWILEEPIHFFDMARWYMEDIGEPVSVYARANSKEAKEKELLENFTAIVNFPKDAYVTISQTLAAFEHHQTVKFTGSLGAILASWAGEMDRDEAAGYQLRYFDGEDIKQIEISEPAGEVFELRMEIEEFLRSVSKGLKPLVSGEDGREAVRLCLAASDSVKKGREVSLDE